MTPLTSLEDMETRRDQLHEEVHSVDGERDPARAGLAHLELGVLLKLTGGLDGGAIEAAFFHLRRALSLLPPEEADARQRAYFVLGLTHGDVSDPRGAVESFEAVERVDAATPAGQAANHYAAAYRERFELE